MDNLKEQIHDVSNPLDLMLDPEYMRQAVAAEDEVGGNIGTGLDWGPLMGKLLTDLPLLGRLTTLRISLNREARLNIEALNLGEGTKDITRVARACIKNRLLAPTETAIPHLKAVLSQDDLYTEEFISNRQVLKSLLKELLTHSDREEIAAAGAVSVSARIVSQLNLVEKALL
ncbi:hypothetical protein NIES4071_104790 (plasmid) [Calothrix sp. NIES-4071]|nr:hypothetical protein NIES4071_104790 [Calothrix sp. NIES-4071]BAZ64897.1 hypothetical protein NIES4105_106300 [Calothrix sp. NIES-4105]